MQQVLPILIIGGLMYVALILPQQRKTKEHRSLLASLQEGDEVVLSSGIHGFVSAIESDVLWVEVADKVELKVSRGAVASKLAPPAGAEADSQADEAQDKDD